MEAKLKVWRKKLTEIFNLTYSSYLDESEIEKRIKFILESIINDKINALNLYKTILYSSTSNYVGKIAIDFRFGFISKNFETYIKNGKSSDIDSLNNKNLNDYIENLCCLINYNLESEMLTGRNVYYLERSENFENIFPIPSGKEYKYVKLYQKNVVYKMSLNQFLYCSTYGINIFNGTRIKIDSGRNSFFENLKRLHPEGFDLEKVKDKTFFG